MKPEITSKIKRIDVLPLIKHYITELGLYELFDKHIPKQPNATMAPAQPLCMMILNIICANRPLYTVEEWLADYTDGTAEDIVNASQYNDDQLGRSLDKLFKSDRNSLMAELSANAIRTHMLELNDIHNDSTSITLAGEYKNQEEGNIKFARGFNKDHRSDCKQIVFGLNITADGNVPLSFLLFDGNRTDDTTHIPNWEGLRKLLGKEDFVYIADCKLCSMKNLNYIHANGGTFITIMPKNRKPVKTFHEYIQNNDIDWQNGMVVEDSRKKGRFVTYRTFEQTTTKEGYRLIWVHSSAKELQDRKRRDAVIKKTLDKLADISKKLNKYKLKTRKQIEAAVKKACKGKRDLFEFNIIEKKETIKKQTSPGKPGSNTVYTEKEVSSFQIEYLLNEKVAIKTARMDGIFPLITNSTMDAADILQKYKNQPYLEKRMYTAKSILNVAPVFLKSPKRIEAILFLYFAALMIVGLIERNIRKNMKEENIEKLPILPGKMKTKTPTWNNLNNFFRSVHLSLIFEGENNLSSTVKGMTGLHYTILRLLNVPWSVYQNIKDQWWIFEPA
jgi:transposase